MDGTLAVLLISAAMFLGSFLLGLIPLLIRLSEEKLQLVSVLGAGLLCGTALAVIIPEGVELLEHAWRVPPLACLSAASINNTTAAWPSVEPEGANGMQPHFFMGLSLVMGFILMFVVDQIGNYCSLHDPHTGMSHRISFTATLGLVIHAAADGVALGAAVASSEVTVQVVVFFAVILHKAPAAFGLVSFLMRAGLEKKQIQKHLLIFSIAAPLMAVSTFFILKATSSSTTHQLTATGIGMLFSAGTFLYVAMVHVMPEISSRGQHHTPHTQHLGILESLTLVLGAGLPVLLALGLHDD